MTSRVSDDNPIGVAPFDHTRLAQVPEYQVAAKALDALVHATRNANIEVAQAKWLQAVTDMAASLPYGDMCTQCRDSDPSAANGPNFPVAIELKNSEQLTAHYECGDCGHRWTTSWAVDLPDLS
jgi:hypothetical protein